MSRSERTHEERQRARRPLNTAEKAVALVGLLVLGVGCANLAKAGIAWRYAQRLTDVPMTVTWGYLVGVGAVWGAALATSAVGLLRFEPWGRIGTLATSSLYQVYVWIDHVLFAVSDYAAETWLWRAVLTMLFISVVWGVLCWPAARRLFRP